MNTQQPEPHAADLPPRRADDLLTMLAERVGARFEARTVFGEPVERGGVTVIPVAAVRVAFGGGAGWDPEEQQHGSGGGGAALGTGIGYIEIEDARTRFVPIVHPARMLATAGAIALAVALVGRRR